MSFFANWVFNSFLEIAMNAYTRGVGRNGFGGPGRDGFGGGSRADFGSAARSEAPRNNNIGRRAQQTPTTLHTVNNNQDRRIIQNRPIIENQRPVIQSRPTYQGGQPTNQNHIGDRRRDDRRDGGFPQNDPLFNQPTLDFNRDRERHRDPQHGWVRPPPPPPRPIRVEPQYDPYRQYGQYNHYNNNYFGNNHYRNNTSYRRIFDHYPNWRHNNGRYETFYQNNWTPLSFYVDNFGQGFCRGPGGDIEIEIFIRNGRYYCYGPNGGEIDITIFINNGANYSPYNFGQGGNFGIGGGFTWGNGRWSIDAGGRFVLRA